MKLGGKSGGRDGEEFKQRQWGVVFDLFDPNTLYEYMNIK